jgi:glyoxylase-like metal-dependent hydrolase (beta-lactamase superfamily II)
MDTQDWYDVQEFAPDTYQFTEAGRWNMFLFIGGERALLLDGGIGIGSARRLCESITDLPIDHVLTHTHWDHVGAVHEWESVGVHPNGKEKLAGDYSAGCRDFIENWKGKPFPEGFDPGTFTIPPGKFGRAVQEGDVLDLGERTLRVWDTPGHSPCSISLFDDRERVLITGDLVKPGMALFIQVPTAVLSDYGPSMRKLENIAKENGAKWVCSGHTDPREDISIIGKMAQFVEEVEAGAHEPPKKVEAGKWGVVDAYEAEGFSVWIKDHARK